MRKADKLPHKHASSKPTETASVRQRFVDFDHDNWDTKLTTNIAAGRPDATAAADLEDQAANKVKSS